MQDEEVITGEENEETSSQNNESDISSSEGDSSSSVVEVQQEYISHLEFIEHQLTGCICFLGVLLGAYLCKALFERFKT